MASVADGVFKRNLPWVMIWIGVAIGAAIIALDKYLEARKIDFRVPVLAVAVGIYLPFELDSAIMLGGILSWMVHRYQKSKSGRVSDPKAQSTKSEATGLLFASGLITGEALMGIGVALIIAGTQNPKILQVGSLGFGFWPGVIMILGICYLLYRYATQSYIEEE